MRLFVLMVGPQLAENTHYFAKIHIPGSFATIKGQTTIGPVLQDRISRCLDVEMIQTTLVAMTRRPSPAKMEMSWSIEETRAWQPKIQSSQRSF